MNANPNVDGHPSGNPNGRSYAKATLGPLGRPFGRRYVRRLWQTGSQPQGGLGQVPMLDLLAHAGLLVPKGMVLSKKPTESFWSKAVCSRIYGLVLTTEKTPHRGY